jgi:hypothetical protein
MSSDYRLAYGTHARPEDGRCAMEWVSHLAGEPHSDEPACVSPVLRALCTTLNDSLEDEPRQRLRPYLARTIGTADDGFDETRAWLAMDWLIRTYAPAWLGAAGLTSFGRRLSTLPPVLGSPELGPALAMLGAARRTTRTAWSHTLRAGRAAAWSPWAVGRATARECAWSSAGAAAWAAARVAVGDISGDRARAAAREIGGDAAAIVARESRTRSSRTAAREAARTALAPTLDELQRSAFDLLDRMLPTVMVGRAISEAAGSEPSVDGFASATNRATMEFDLHFTRAST